ncbi:MAG: hypothetical protein methR_P0108 [Methyloprofundus sp.]|nr:MAG: hypothetical protein methR_P0108 [Methyloprofundus sp.]
MKIWSIVILFISSVTVGYGQTTWDAPTQKLLDTPMGIVVYRSPTCGCCSKWLEHLKRHDFNVIDNVTENMQDIKDKYGVTRSLASCHTAIINGYIVEGHVPARDIKSMLKAKAVIKGLTVPGMVVGTPGMEMGVKKIPFKVLAFDKQGKMALYKSYEQY